ncbi:beta-1,3-galactosyltransferase 5-like [Thunnus maccoyii]|uniref:beta-1,3-galactosyltransferase 5-like n=1 Tax=Thunnus maccoyii TaxID=8240 RepID=UPI001C4C27ED|nr:beta-1,3-galactosyltransferase 5-like [Thunnus maccoyii]
MLESGFAKGGQGGQSKEMKLAESKRWCRWSRCHGCFFILVLTVVVFYYNTNIKEMAHDWSPKWWMKYNATKWFIPFNSHNNVFPNVSDPSTPGSTPELTTAAGLTTVENLSTFPQTENIAEITSRTVADRNTPHQTENSSPVTQQITQKKNVKPTPIPYVSPGPYVVEYPYDYHFIINESKKCEEQKPFLVLIVPVAPNNKAHRDIIRRTWGSQSEVQGKVVKLFFLLGMHSGDGVEQVQEQVQQESKEHQDLIQSNFVDCYKNLTIKTMMMLEWLDSYCSDASYAMKIDSDTFLNLPLLINMLSNAPKTNYMTGLVAGNAAVLRDPSSKWFLPLDLYPNPQYPRYALGLGYILSLDLPKKLVAASRHVKALYIEDVYLGLCMQYLGLSPTNPPNWGYFIVSPLQYNRCTFSGLVVCLLADNTDRLWIWKDYNRPGPYC